MSERPTDAPPARFPRQAAVVALALVLFAVWGRMQVAALVACYVAAIVLLNLAITARRDLLPNLGRWQAAILLGVPVLAPLAALHRHRSALWNDAGLRGVVEVTRDRLALEETPTLFPRTIAGDHPQRLYAFARGASSASLSLREDLPAVEGTPLGRGVFRFSYDPARHGAPAAVSGPFEVRLTVGGKSVKRSLDASVPLARPRWLASFPGAGVAAAVSEETDDIVIFRATGEFHLVRVGDAPTDLAFFDSGRRIAVAHRFSPEIFVVDVEHRTVEKRIDVGSRGMGRVALSPDGSTLAVALAGGPPGVELVALTTEGQRSSVRLGFRPDHVAFGASGDELIASWRERKTLYRLRRTTSDDGGLELPRRTGSAPSGWRLDATTLPMGRPAVAVHRTRDGQQLLVASTGRSEDGAEVPGNHFVEHRIVSIDLPRWRIGGERVTGRLSNEQDRASAMEHGSGPVAFTDRADGTLLVAFSGSDEVWTLAQGASEPTAITRVGPELSAPHGLADLGQGRFAVSSPSSGTLGVFDSNGARTALAQVGPADEDLEQRDRVAWLRRQGERAFYEATRSGIACHSCHVFADSDYSRHNIGQPTQLPTLSTFGIAGTSPYLRDASYPRVRDMMQVAEDVYRGFRNRAKADRGESLEAFVESLAPLPLPPAAEENLDRERAGMEAFFSARCPLCHTPPAFTNLGQVPAKAVFPEYSTSIGDGHTLDVPTLVGLATSPPYLHDGRAQTLEDVLVEHNASDRHGNVRALSDGERADLVYLLERL